jgi:hypothetical protein
MAACWACCAAAPAGREQKRRGWGGGWGVGWALSSWPTRRGLVIPRDNRQPHTLMPTAEAKHPARRTPSCPPQRQSTPPAVHPHAHRRGKAPRPPHSPDRRRPAACCDVAVLSSRWPSPEYRPSTTVGRRGVFPGGATAAEPPSACMRQGTESLRKGGCGICLNRAAMPSSQLGLSFSVAASSCAPLPTRAPPTPTPLVPRAHHEAPRALQQLAGLLLVEHIQPAERPRHQRAQLAQQGVLKEVLRRGRGGQRAHGWLHGTHTEAQAGGDDGTLRRSQLRRRPTAGQAAPRHGEAAQATRGRPCSGARRRMHTCALRATPPAPGPVSAPRRRSSGL